MMKELTIVNYCNNIYEIFIKENSLFIKIVNCIIKIEEKITDYTVLYDEDLIWIACCYKDILKVYKIILTNENVSALEKEVVLEYKAMYKQINELYLAINSHQKAIIFTSYNEANDSTYLFNVNFHNKVTTNIISACNNRINKALSVSRIEDAYYILCSVNNSGKYMLYNLFEEKVVTALDLKQEYESDLIYFMNKLLFFYWEGKETVNEINYKAISINNSSIYVEDTKNIGVSVPKGKIDINTNGQSLSVLINAIDEVFFYTTRNLLEWKINKFKISNKFNKCYTIKVNENDIKISRLYINKKQDNYLDKYRKDKVVKANSNNTIEILKRQKYRVEMVQKYERLFSIDNYYGKVCSNYLDRINELLKIIEEKDDIIANLLEIK